MSGREKRREGVLALDGMGEGVVRNLIEDVGLLIGELDEGTLKDVRSEEEEDDE